MKLNGWRRHWVVVLALWAVPVTIMCWLFWPTVGAVARADVYAAMNEGSAKRLADYHNLLSPVVGRVLLPPVGAEVTELMKESASFEDDLKEVRAEAAGERLSSDPNAGEPLQPARVIQIAGGERLQFLQGVPVADAQRTVAEYVEEQRRLLERHRAAFVAGVLGWWIVPALAVYAFGWAFAWVRRGFREPQGVG